jgi:hypothetical protein
MVFTAFNPGFSSIFLLIAKGFAEALETIGEKRAKCKS